MSGSVKPQLRTKGLDVTGRRPAQLALNCKQINRYKILYSSIKSREYVSDNEILGIINRFSQMKFDDDEFASLILHLCKKTTIGKLSFNFNYNFKQCCECLASDSPENGNFDWFKNCNHENFFQEYSLATKKFNKTEKISINSIYSYELLSIKQLTLYSEELSETPFETEYELIRKKISLKNSDIIEKSPKLVFIPVSRENMSVISVNRIICMEYENLIRSLGDNNHSLPTNISKRLNSRFRKEIILYQSFIFLSKRHH